MTVEWGCNQSNKQRDTYVHGLEYATEKRCQIFWNWNTDLIQFL